MPPLPLRRRPLAAAFFGVLALMAWGARADPVFVPDGPQAAAYGQAQGYPVPRPGLRPDELRQELYVGLHSHYDQVRPLKEVPTAGAPSPLSRAAQSLELQYAYEGRSLTLNDYLRRHPVTGLLIARDSTILFERYQYGRRDSDRFLSHSLAKTITGLLVGAALEDGAIRSIDDKVSAYLPELAGTAYGATPIRALLTMSSGLAFNESYQPNDDVHRLAEALVGPSPLGAVAAVRQFDARVAEPGTVFHYASADSQVLGMVVSRAVGMPLPEYFSRRLWAPLGAEANAAWDTDPSGEALGFCCVVARLRDWARLGLMLAHDGRWNGRQVVSRPWVHESTTPARGLNAPYGYQIWLSGEAPRYYAMRGVLGQFVLIDPITRFVLVQTAVNLNPTDPGATAELTALWQALLVQHGPPGRFGRTW